MVQKNSERIHHQDPEITLKMSEEKIAEMKAKVNELVKNTEKIVQGEFDNLRCGGIKNRVCTIH